MTHCLAEYIYDSLNMEIQTTQSQEGSEKQNCCKQQSEGNCILAEKAEGWKT
jgi:hypothetical protein